MPYAAPFIKMTVSGGIATEDIWSNGLSILALAPNNAAALFSSLEPEQFITAVSAFYAGANPSANTYVNLRTIKLALVGTDGKYLADAKIYDYPTPVAGVGTFAVSPQDSVVLSLLTGFKRGLARRGRIFLPAGFAVPVATTGRIADTAVTAVATKGRTYINALNSVINNGSRTGTIGITSNQREGMEHIVNGVEVGNIMDNQSRRRNRLQEVYTELPLFTPPVVP